MGKAQYEVSLSGLARRSHAVGLAPQLDWQPLNARVILGYSTGYHLPHGSELKRRPGLYVPLLSVAKLQAELSADYLAHFTPNLQVGIPVQEQVLFLYTMAGARLSGIQINLARVSPAIIASVSMVAPGREVVIPAGRLTMRQIARQDPVVVAYLGEVKSAGATVLLLDNSAGQGGPLTYEELRGCVETVVEHVGLRIRVAGRLGTDCLEVVERLLRDYPTLPFGWEVESRLRNELDQFDLNRACRYLAKSFELIEQADKI